MKTRTTLAIALILGLSSAALWWASGSSASSDDLESSSRSPTGVTHADASTPRRSTAPTTTSDSPASTSTEREKKGLHPVLRRSAESSSGIRIEGFLRDSEGCAVPDYRVLVRPRDGEDRACRTDAHGQYRCDFDLTDDPWFDARAESPGSPPATGAVRLAEGARGGRIDLRFPRRVPLNGVVVDQFGAGVAGLEISGLNNAGIGSPILRVRTDEQGRFSFPEATERGLYIAFSQPSPGANEALVLPEAFMARPEGRTLRIEVHRETQRWIPLQIRLVDHATGRVLDSAKIPGGLIITRENPALGSPRHLARVDGVYRGLVSHGTWVLTTTGNPRPLRRFTVGRDLEEYVLDLPQGPPATVIVTPRWLDEGGEPEGSRVTAGLVGNAGSAASRRLVNLTRDGPPAIIEGVAGGHRTLVVQTQTFRGRVSFEAPFGRRVHVTLPISRSGRFELTLKGEFRGTLELETERADGSWSRLHGTDLDGSGPSTITIPQCPESLRWRLRARRQGSALARILARGDTTVPAGTTVRDQLVLDP